MPTISEAVVALVAAATLAGTLDAITTPSAILP